MCLEAMVRVLLNKSRVNKGEIIKGQREQKISESPSEIIKVNLMESTTFIISLVLILKVRLKVVDIF